MNNKKVINGTEGCIVKITGEDIFECEAEFVLGAQKYLLSSWTVAPMDELDDSSDESYERLEVLGAAETQTELEIAVSSDWTICQKAINDMWEMFEKPIWFSQTE